MTRQKPVVSKLLEHYNRIEDGLAVLERQLGYHFVDISYPKQALTHRSFDPKHSYERLEFLGDALLGAIIGEYLYHHYDKLDEGQLTRLRATLVRQETLVRIAEKLQLHRHIILGVGERKSGGRHRASILADAVEALLAAIYLDSASFEQARQCVLSWYAEILTENQESTLKDAKSRLQEWLQAYRLPLPNYELVGVVGNSPEQVFTVRCTVVKAGIEPIEQSAHSRRIAEQKCAELMINQLNLSQL